MQYTKQSLPVTPIYTKPLQVKSSQFAYSHLQWQNSINSQPMSHKLVWVTPRTPACLLGSTCCFCLWWAEAELPRKCAKKKSIKLTVKGYLFWPEDTFLLRSKKLQGKQHGPYIGKRTKSKTGDEVVLASYCHHVERQGRKALLHRNRRRSHNMTIRSCCNEMI